MDGFVQRLPVCDELLILPGSIIRHTQVDGLPDLQRAAVPLSIRRHFARPGKGNDKGKVEGLVGYARRNFMVPIPHAAGFAELNAQLLACCRRRSATDPQ